MKMKAKKAKTAQVPYKINKISSYITVIWHQDFQHERKNVGALKKRRRKKYPELIFEMLT